jgi:hypothetical protein
VLVSVSAVVLFGFFVCFLLKTRSLSVSACFVTAMFGFFLASTGAAAPINQFTADMAGFVAGIGR